MGVLLVEGTFVSLYTAVFAGVTLGSSVASRTHAERIGPNRPEPSDSFLGGDAVKMLFKEDLIPPRQTTCVRAAPYSPWWV